MFIFQLGNLEEFEIIIIIEKFKYIYVYGFVNKYVWILEFF